MILEVHSISEWLPADLSAFRLDRKRWRWHCGHQNSRTYYKLLWREVSLCFIKYNKKKGLKWSNKEEAERWEDMMGGVSLAILDPVYCFPAIRESMEMDIVVSTLQPSMCQRNSVNRTSILHRTTFWLKRMHWTWKMLLLMKQRPLPRCTTHRCRN